MLCKFWAEIFFFFMKMKFHRVSKIIHTISIFHIESCAESCTVHQIQIDTEVVLVMFTDVNLRG